MKPYSTDLRRKIVETKSKTNESIQQLADRFQVSYSFVNRLLKRYQTTQRVEPSPHGGGKPPSLNSQQLNIVSQLVEEDNDATLQQLCERLAEKTGIKVSVPTMCRLLQKLNLTRKKKTLHANEAETERVQNLRREYWTTIGEVKLSDLVFIDETGVRNAPPHSSRRQPPAGSAVNLAMTRHYGRAKKGLRAYGRCPYNRGRNITLIGAIAASGFLAPFTFEGWTNQEAFLTNGQGLVNPNAFGFIPLTYVTKVLTPQLWPGACVVMDNLPAHKATRVREAIESVGAKIEFLSPYSPDFNEVNAASAVSRRKNVNPIENCWSKVKEYLRRQESRTNKEINQSINEAINLVTDNDIIGWFTHCCYYAPSN